MQNSQEEPRLYELGLPVDIVEISRTQLDLPPRARDRVESLVKEYEERITTIQNHIWSLELPREYYTRKRLIQERDSIPPKLEACRSLLTIVRRIPVEILGQIFEHYLSPGEVVVEGKEDNTMQVDEEDSEPSAPPPKPSAEILCLVCRYWQAVAVSTPAVWSNIVLYADQIQGQLPLVKPSQARRFTTCMDRLPYGTWTLDVRAGEVRRFSRSKYKDVDGPTAVSVPLSHLLDRQPTSRLTRFSFSGHILGVGLGKMGFPGIGSVVIWCPLSLTNRNPTLPDLPSMPSLTQAVLWGIASPNYFPTHIPWSQLTHLFLGDRVTAQRWRSIFKRCISLQRACFCLTNRQELQRPIPHEPAQATLLHLTELAFLWGGPNAEALQGITMPALTKLQLFVDWEPLAWDFLHPQRYANLTHLTLISPSPLNAAHLIPVFETAPQLRELFFKIFYEFKEVFNYLTYGSHHGFKLRSLRALGIHMDTQRYRTMYLDEEDEEDEEDEGFPPFLTFPYPDAVDLIASRTRSLQRGDFNIVPFANQLQRLENVVLRTDSYEWADEIVEKLKREVEPFAAYGLDVGIFELNDFGRHHGQAPSPTLGRCMHWDEGFMGFMDNLKEYSLYPRAL